MIYLAAPIWLYDDPIYAQAVADLEGRGLDVCDMRRLYRGNSDWLERWPVEKDRYEACWIVTDGHGWIGRGVDVERRDLAALGRPVRWWNRDTDVFDLSPTTGDWRRWRRLLPVRA